MLFALINVCYVEAILVLLEVSKNRTASINLANLVMHKILDAIFRLFF